MSFEKAFNTLQKDTENIWQRLSACDAQTLNHAPIPGKWSALQHMVHLNKSERSLVVLLNKAIKNKAPLHGNVLKIKLRSLAYAAFLTLGMKFKAPKIMEPAPEVFDLEALKKDYAKTRAQLKQIMESITETQAKQFWVHHPILKEMRARDALSFMIFHQNHHRKAIELIVNY